MFQAVRRSRWTNARIGTLLLGAVFVAAGCGNGDADEPGVFFVQPSDGATVTSPVAVILGARNLQIGAVPEVVEVPREGVVHYHLGTNTDCVPPGIVIPQADPWIHFGDGSNEIEMYLEPGEHRLAVQAGDDEHRTIEGLCQVITVTVDPEPENEG